MKVYKPQPSFIASNSIVLVFPLVVTLFFLNDATTTNSQWQGIALFWLLILILIVSPLGSRLEIGTGSIKTRFWGIVTSVISSKDVEAVEYGNLFRGGLGFGKGLKIATKKINGVRRYYSIGEKIYGKDAITYAKQVLSHR